MIYLCGGPPHQDMYEIKVDAPAEVRGEFDPIPTAVPGIEICELLPNMARIMDKLVPIRTVVGCKDDHAGYQCFTGHLSQNAPAGGWPHIGSLVVATARAGRCPACRRSSACATSRSTSPTTSRARAFWAWATTPSGRWAKARDDLVLQGITADRLGDRQAACSRRSISFRRAVGRQPHDGRPRHVHAAGDGHSHVVRVLQRDGRHARKSQKTRDRYGYYDPKQAQGRRRPRVPQNLLLARRLIEAGVRVVTVNYSFWDWHGQNFKNAKEELPIFDKAVAALVEDLHERGLADDCTVVAWGEFGRTPKINKDAGRDHWPRRLAAPCWPAAA